MEQIINEKECRLCNETKLLDDFNKSICGKFGYANECKECRKQARKKLNYPRIKEGNKICNNCNTTKDVSEFNSNSKNTDGLRSVCKLCLLNHTYSVGSTFDGFIKMLYYDLISNAKKRNIQVYITIDDIKSQYENQLGFCALTGFKLTWTKYPIESQFHINNKFNISVDRIDSNKDYTKDNIQLVCAMTNIIKYRLSEDKFIELCKKISKNKNLM